MTYDLAQMEVFAVVAEAGSLGRAAMDLHLTHFITHKFFSFLINGL